MLINWSKSIWVCVVCEGERLSENKNSNTKKKAGRNKRSMQRNAKSFWILYKVFLYYIISCCWWRHLIFFLFAVKHKASMRKKDSLRLSGSLHFRQRKIKYTFRYFTGICLWCKILNVPHTVCSCIKVDVSECVSVSVFTNKQQ